MDDPSHDSELFERFGTQPPDILAELRSMLHIFGVDAEELYYKWESYGIQMDVTSVTLETVRAFKKNVQDRLDKEMAQKRRAQQNQSSVHKTPRAPAAVGGDMFDDLMGGMTTPRSTVKRKLERAPFDTPTNKSTRMMIDASSPLGAGTPLPFRTPSKTAVPEAVTLFKQRTNPGEVLEILNPSNLPKPTLPHAGESTFESRVRFAFNLEIKKFSYRNMYQKIAEASETIDERIDDFQKLIQERYSLPDEAFRDPSDEKPDEIVAIGRICSDSLGGERTNSASILLESSRMSGSGARVKLDLSKAKSYALFPGQIVAVRGVNSSGEFFTVKEILEPLPLPPPPMIPDEVYEFQKALEDGPMTMAIASGPYTTEDNLDYEALDALTEKLAEQRPDVVIMFGPFVDSEHPMVKEGDFELQTVDQAEGGTLEDLFRERVAPLLKRLSGSMVFIVPSLRDAVSKHLSFPQEAFKIPKQTLGLPKNYRMLPSPSVLSLNDVVIGLSSADILFHLSSQEISQFPLEPVRPARLTSHLLRQRSFYPLMPPQIPLDVPHMRLADMVNVTPDLLLLPSRLAPFARVVENVVTVNPGQLSKPRGAGTYVEMSVVADVVRAGEEHQERGRRVFERSRVEVVRI